MLAFVFDDFGAAGLNVGPILFIVGNTILLPAGRTGAESTWEGCFCLDFAT